MGPLQVLLLQMRIDLGVFAMKRYSTFTKAPGLIQFSVISKTPFFGGGGEVCSPLQGIHLAYSKSHQQSTKTGE